ncbi:MAG: type IX secretion system membrane protein PorP/SprF [Bacteroidia bacterium]|nr:type IX secretion system membrane protein PorP/SprF [Bacteroidia bacterium]MCZ2247209.1 type IX secretion system membrane protein PorP/SprF [Bacteroidia bacterium]
MKKLIIAITLSLTSLGLQAQQDIMLSQYMFNGLFLNPAYSGSHKYAGATLLHRNQWTGWDGAPKTNIVGIDGPLRNHTMGWGLIFANDKIGPTKQNDFMGNYSYHLKLGKGKLALGLRAGVSAVSSNLMNLSTTSPGDEAFTNVKSAIMPKFGTGAYYYAAKYYAGISVPTLIAYDPNNNFSLDLNKSSDSRRHYFITGGYVFDLSNTVKLKPSVLLKYQKAAPLQADINCNVLINDVFWIGASYRTNDAVIGIIEYQINPILRIGYAYDYTTTAIGRYSSGSHEVMIGIDFGRDIMKSKNPRYF